MSFDLGAGDAQTRARASERDAKVSVVAAAAASGCKRLAADSLGRHPLISGAAKLREPSSHSRLRRRELAAAALGAPTSSRAEAISSKVRLVTRLAPSSRASTASWSSKTSEPATFFAAPRASERVGARRATQSLREGERAQPASRLEANKER